MEIHEWRNVKIVGTLLREADDIRGKQSAITRVNIWEKVWILRDTSSMTGVARA